MKKNFIAYTDGSCDNKNPIRPGGAAYIILDETEKVVIRRSNGYLKTTNNRMELLAIVSVVNAVPIASSITIYTDSEYCIKALLSKTPRKNLDLIALYHRLRKEKHLSVSLQWVKGHDGNKYNEECDRMAQQEYQFMRDNYTTSTTKRHQK